MPDSRPHVGQRDALFSAIIQQNNRADPSPPDARLRQNPVSRQRDGSYVASSHAAIESLIFDPRLSSEDLPPSRRPHTGKPLRDWFLNPIRNRIVTAHRPLIFRDPPDHDSLRRFVMRQFMVWRVNALREGIVREVDRLIDACRGRDRICLVDDFSYPRGGFRPVRVLTRNRKERTLGDRPMLPANGIFLEFNRSIMGPKFLLIQHYLTK